MRITSLILAVASVSWTLPAKANQSETLPQQVTLEQSITDHLHGRLDGLIPKERYKLIVNVRANEERVKVLLEGETQSQSDGKEQAPAETALPGFQLIEKGLEAQKVQKNERSKFTFKTRTALKEVGVKLILDQSLDQQRKDLVTDIVKSALTSSFGTVGKLEAVELDLTNVGVPVVQRIGNWFSSYLDARGGSAIDLAYLLGLALIFLVAALTMGRKFLKFRRSMSSKPTPPAEAGVANKDSKASEQLINQIIDSYVQAPLEVRRFLLMLPERERRVFLHSIRAPALRGYFEGILATASGVESDVARGSPDKFEGMVSDLERYLTIQKEQIKHPFGFLETFEAESLRHFVESEPDRVQSVAAMSPYLRKDQYVALTDGWPVSDKVRLFKTVHQGVSDPQFLQLLEARMREQYQSLREKGIVQIKNHMQVERDILENDADVNEMLSQLVKEQFQLSPEYLKYRVTFADLLAMDHEVMRSVLRAVPNETLAKALVRQQKGMDSWTKLVGDVRFKLIDSIRARYNHLDQNDVMQAQREILRAYRAMV